MRRLPPHQIDPAGAADGDGIFYDAGTDRFQLGPPPSGGSLTVQDENSNVATGVTQIDFQGSGVTTTSGTGEVIVTIPGGGGTPTHHGCCVVRSSATQTMASTGTAVIFNDTEEWDTDSMHDTVANNTRITIPAGLGGRWSFNGNLLWAASTAFKSWRLTVNGSIPTNDMYRVRELSGASAVLYQPATYVLNLVAGDYVELVGLPSATSTINQARLTCHYLG